MQGGAGGRKGGRKGEKKEGERDRESARAEERERKSEGRERAEILNGQCPSTFLCVFYICVSVTQTRNASHCSGSVWANGQSPTTFTCKVTEYRPVNLSSTILT